MGEANPCSMGSDGSAVLSWSLAGTTGSLLLREVSPVDEKGFLHGGSGPPGI